LVGPRGRFAAPDLVHQLERLVPAAAAGREILLGDVEVVLAGADRSPKDEPAARDLVEAGEVFGQQDGVVDRAEQYVRHQADALRRRGSCGQGYQLGIGRIRDATEGAQGGEAPGFGTPGPGDQDVAAGPADGVGKPDPDLHPRLRS
jgi:hypothetical protein